MKIWNTKYCLTAGITEHEVNDTQDDIVAIRGNNHSFEMFLHGEGKDWHRSLSAAMLRAQEVKLKKLGSLAKSIKKISLISFEAQTMNKIDGINESG